MSGEASSKAGGIRQPPSQRVSSLLKSTVASIAHTVADPVQDVLTAPATRRTVAGAAALSTVVLLSIGTAVVAYITFYCLYIPKIGFSKEVLLQYGYGRPPFGVVDLSQTTFASDQMYDVSLELLVPTSRRNMDIGNFMVELDLQSAEGTSILKAARSAFIINTPQSVQLLDMFLRLPFVLFMPLRSTTQRIVVPLVKQHLLRTFMATPVAQAVVQVGRHDAYKGETCGSSTELQVYAAKLLFKARLRGFRSFMYHHRIISFLVFTTAFLTATLLSALSLWGILLLRSALASRQESLAMDQRTDSTSRYSWSSDYTTASTVATGTTSATGTTGSTGTTTSTLAERSRREEAEWEREAKEAQATYGRWDLMREEEKSVLSGLKIGSNGSDDEGVIVKAEDDDEGDEEASPTGSSGAWQDFEDDAAQGPIKEEEDEVDDKATVAGSATSAGDAASRLSFGPSVTTATSASVSSPSLRQRPSSRSLRASSK